MKEMITRIIMYILGILCIIYCIEVGKVHSGNKFYFVWLLIGVFFIALGVCIRFKVWDKMPKWAHITICGVFGLGICLLIVLTGLVFSKFSTVPQKKVDYIIVLGAQVKNDGPSVVLRYRMEKACEYMKENPEVKCIASGGQGSNEPCSEAQAIADYLISGGISEDRIILEDKSTDTSENIRFSKKLLPEGASVAVLTNNFHLRRALYLANRYGIAAEGIAADSTLFYLPNNVLRETIGLLKDFIIRPKE